MTRPDTSWPWHPGYADPPGFRFVSSDGTGVLIAGEHFFGPVPGNAELTCGIGDNRAVVGVGLATEEYSLEHAEQLAGKAVAAR